MFSRPILGTNKNKTKLSWWEYWIEHCWMSGWWNIRFSFMTWYDLMTDNHLHYSLLKDDDSFEECYKEFWYELGQDDTYPKEFLESLLEMLEDVRTGKVELIPFTSDMFDELDNLVGDLIEESDS